MNTKTNRYILLIFGYLLCATALGAQDSGSQGSKLAGQILSALQRAAAEQRQFQTRARLISKKPNTANTESQLHLYVDRNNGVQKSLAKILAPERSEGQIFLNNGAAYWVYYPKLQRSLALSPLATLTGDVSIGDILAPPALQIYSPKVLESDENTVRLELTKTSRTAPYTRIVQHYKGMLLDNAEFYGGHDGKILMKKAQYLEPFKNSSGYYFYTQVKILNMLESGSYSVIAFDKPQDTNIPSSWFNPNNLQQVP